MPLTRYDIRNEYSLANPDLYRAAAKDDPEGLLEGVAMAGLVGIVRQLGDLAEFAAEVFHDLHEEVLATAARGHELLVRVQQLEAELPVVEKFMLAETNHVHYAYNPGVEWHASIRNDQNHFTQGDLPRFIRNAYEDCRGPPRLFLLDKFDVAGAGACLKRYTDPSFFKTEWARSELLKAEKEQQDKRARRIKRKGRRRRNGELQEGSHLAHMHLRKPVDVEKIKDAQASSPFDLKKVDKSNPTLKFDMNCEDDLDAPILPGQDSALEASTSETINEMEGESVKVVIESYAEGKTVLNEIVEPLDIASSQTNGEDEVIKGEIHVDVQLDKDVDLGFKMEDDAASETDQYVDALTTMDSEVETDTEQRIKMEADHGFSSDEREQSPYIPSLHKIPDEMELDDKYLETRESNASDYHAESPGSAENLVGFDDLETKTGPENNASFEGGERESLAHYLHRTRDEPIVVKSLSLDQVDEVPHVDGNGIPSVVEEIDNESPVREATPQSSSTKKDVVSGVEVYLDTESVDHISETPQTSEPNEKDSPSVQNLSAAFHCLPEADSPLSHDGQIGFFNDFDRHDSQLHPQPSEPFDGGARKTVTDRDIVVVSESEPSDSPKVASPNSSAGSTIQPIRWSVDEFRVDSSESDDDDMNGMQVSSGSPSLSSSTLSSPRPSTLATTVFHMDMVGKLPSLFSSQESNVSSPKSLTGLDLSQESLKSTSPKSLVSSKLGSPHSLVEEQYASPPKSFPFSASLSPPHLHQSDLDALPWSSLHAEAHSWKESMEASSAEVIPGLVLDESMESPPPPPLPPLEWRVMTRTRNNLSGFSKKLSPSPPSLSFPPMRYDESVEDAEGEYSLDPPARTGCSLETSDGTTSPVLSVKEGPSIVSNSKLSLEELDATMFHPSLLLADEEKISFDDEAAQSSPPTQSRTKSSSPLPTSSIPDQDVQDLEPMAVSKLLRRDSLIEAIASHDRNSLRKVPELGRSQTAPSNDRQVLLEQIRTGSFSLRQTKVERQEAPRPVTNINVAAILEKANAIRQAFIGSDEDEDEDDDWSDG